MDKSKVARFYGPPCNTSQTLAMDDNNNQRRHVLQTFEARNARLRQTAESF